jgi:transcriptional regulator of acetoin/glycerol metabolism
MPAPLQPTPAASPFFVTREARVELARRRYFDDGVAPTGIVSDAVFQSWARCQRLHSGPGDEVVFEPVTPSRTHLSLQKNRPLLDAWLAELPQLESLLGQTTCAAMLTDASGVLIGATCAGRSHEHVMPIATRLGVDLSEEAVGTTAPGVVARTGQPVNVIGGEHFFDGIGTMHCAAAPVRDIRGNVAGVLDLSSEGLDFGFDAAAVVGVYASAIENRLLAVQAREHLVVRLQVAQSLLDSPFAGLVGIDASGRVSWCNAAAARLLGERPEALAGRKTMAEAVLGLGISALASLPCDGAAVVKLPNGLSVWARARMQAPDGRRGFTSIPSPETTSSPAPSVEPQRIAVPFPVFIPLPVRVAEPAPAATTATLPPDAKPAVDETTSPGEPAAPGGAADIPGPLHDAYRDLIARAFEECGRNLSETARRLGVSRGLVYRRLFGPGRFGPPAVPSRNSRAKG